MKAYQIILFTAILAISIHSTVAVDYNYYVFASIWQGTNCKMRACNQTQLPYISNQFINIHGLWPNYWKGYPSFCDNSSLYDPTAIDPVTKLKMLTFWNGMNWTNQDFHTHEWTKHGTCWNDPSGNVSNSQKIEDYFSTIVNFATTINLFATLKNANIVPNDDSPYQLSNITEAFDQRYGNGTYILECEKDTNGDQYIFSIYLCVTIDMKLFKCPSNIAPFFNDLCPEGPIHFPKVHRFGNVEGGDVLDLSQDDEVEQDLYDEINLLQ